MKKILFPIMATALLMVSCLEDKGNHMTMLIRPTGMACIYADQPSDTLWYQTTEKHRLIASASWLHPLDDVISEVNFKEDVLYDFVIPMNFDPNTTGKVRSGAVTISAGEYSAGAYFAQLPTLNVIRPMRLLDTYAMEVIPIGPLADSASVTVDSISFTTFGKWTLSTGRWATPEQTSGEPGKYTVRLNLQPYYGTDSDRRDTLLLTSCGVTDSIPLLQYKRRLKVE
ncbi:MAG: hypothetical protein IJT75_04510 [Bacteroidaceae bacterium]|nr:hypothetical protein [Bacteroidaceae bacterium]